MKSVGRVELAASLKMLRFVRLGVTRRDMTRNECIGETAQVELFEDKVREVGWDGLNSGVEYGAARQEGEEKTAEKIHGRSGWRDRKAC